MSNVINLEVYRDNKPDATYARQEALRSFLTDFKQIGEYVTGYAKHVAHNVAEDVSLGVFDQIHGTHLYQQKYDQLKAEVIARKAGSIGLLH